MEALEHHVLRTAQRSDAGSVGRVPYLQRGGTCAGNQILICWMNTYVGYETRIRVETSYHFGIFGETHGTVPSSRSQHVFFRVVKTSNGFMFMSIEGWTFI